MPIGRPEARRRLWCFPPAGGGASIWFPWRTLVGDDTEMVALRFPGRESRLGEKPFIRTDALVTALVAELVPHCSDRDVFCGHSLGALIAFESARRLRSRGLASPHALIVCGSPAPHLPRKLPPLHALSVAEFVPEVERRYGPIPRAVRDHPEFLDLLLPTLRADLAVYETHDHEPAAPLQVPLLALGGDRDAVVTADEIQAWSEHTTVQFTTSLVPGGHFFPQENPAETTRRVRVFLDSLGREA